MNNVQRKPKIRLPVLAAPVDRDGWTESAERDSAAIGVQAAKSACGGLSGPARQMCYSARYGVQV
jgi:hypothetical protein